MFSDKHFNGCMQNTAIRKLAWCCFSYGYKLYK